MARLSWFIVALTALISLGASNACRAQAAATTADLDRAFVCPEALADDAARRAALAAFFTTYVGAVPNATPADFIAFRRTLLEKHACAGTLHNLHEADAAVAQGKVMIQAWLPISDDPSLGASLAVSTNHTKLFLDPRFPDEKAVEIYSKLSFKAPRTAEPSGPRYDTVVSHAIYYCRSARYALMQNDFFLAEQDVFKDVRPFTEVDGVKVYELIAVPTGSFNATAARWACGSVRGSNT